LLHGKGKKRATSGTRPADRRETFDLRVTDAHFQVELPAIEGPGSVTLPDALLNAATAYSVAAPLTTTGQGEDFRLIPGSVSRPFDNLMVSVILHLDA
jgi:hypothetical protein